MLQKWKGKGSKLEAVQDKRKKEKYNHKGSFASTEIYIKQTPIITLKDNIILATPSSQLFSSIAAISLRFLCRKADFNI